jgi:hypothetical protein
MTASPSPREPTSQRAHRLTAARRGRFFGRRARLGAFRAALAAEAPFAALFISGPDGIGKTALVHEYARIASECDRPVVQLDGRNFDPPPAAFLAALERAIAAANGGARIRLPGERGVDH